MEHLRMHKGITVVEVMIGLVLFMLIFVFIYQTLTTFFESQSRALATHQAVYLAQEGQELLRFLRDDDWDVLDGLAKNTQLGLAVSTTTIGTSGSAETIDGFTRTFVLQNGYRNGSNDLVASTTGGASVDADSIIAIVEVTWGNGQSLALQSLLTNLHNQ